MTADARPATARARDRRLFWATFLGLWLLTAAWAVANPLMASPDEPAHALRAAAVARGQVLLSDVPGGSLARLPAYYAVTTTYPVCYMYRPDETAACAPEAEGPLDEVADAVTPAGKYNPLYYAVVGLPSLLPPGDGVLYLMRVLSAGLCAAFVAAGLRALAQTPAPGWALAGASAALTPMTVFLCSTINPAGLEIAAAFALWCQLLTLLRHPDPALVGRRMAWVAVSASVLVNARGLSLLWCAAIVATVLVAAPWSAVRDVLRRRSTWPSFAVIAVAGLAAAGWVLGVGSLGTDGPDMGNGLTVLEAAKITLLDWDAHLVNMLGYFGWMDTPLPTGAYVAWGAALGVVVLPALALGTRRDRWALALVAVATAGLPVLVHASQAPHLGLIWQGRYVLPLAVGLPVLAGYVLAGRADAAAPAVRPAAVAAGSRVAVAVVALTTGVQAVALAVNTHRYVNGLDGPLTGLEPDAWLPPAGLAVAGLLGVVGVVGWGVAQGLVARHVPAAAELPPGEPARDGG